MKIHASVDEIKIKGDNVVVKFKGLNKDQVQQLVALNNRLVKVTVEDANYDLFKGENQ